MNEGISVRTCNAADLDTLLSISIKTFRDSFDEFNSPENMLLYINKTFTRKAIEREMKQPGTVFLLAVDSKKPAGYAKIKASENPQELTTGSFLEIERLYVHKEYIGKRVGYILMQTCLAYAEKKKCERLWLGVWENNTRAIAFYEKHGFKKFGQHEFILGNDVQTDWLMEKKLKAESRK